MSLSLGSRVGPYEIVAKLGQGGMGQVFRARDHALNRDVAIKVLPPDFANDSGRRDRLVREARMLASLSHPRIVGIYGVEQTGDRLAIVMELVEGRPLGDVIRAGSLGRRRALAIARDVAEALDAAHEKGLIHRDLKPANIIVTPDDRARVLDFGLAKTADDGEVTDSATTIGATTPGAVLGTPAYMSPEQARGHAVDPRADIWAFGCVLFELLTGKRAFAGATVSDTIAGVLERDPAWSEMPADTPSGIVRLIRRCLEKDHRRRLRDIGHALDELSSESGVDSLHSGSASLTSGRRSSHARWLTVGLATAAIAFAASTLWLLVNGRTAPAATGGGATIRFDLPAPKGSMFGSLLSGIEATTLAMAPDGSALAFVATTGRTPAVWIRVLANDTARLVAGTEGAIAVFWSPDARALAFFADGQLKRIDAAGGTAVKICDVPVGVGLSGSWGLGGDILFATIQGDGIRRVPAAGGAPSILVEGFTTGTSRVSWPRFLPDGTRFVYTAIDSKLQGSIRLARTDGTAVELVLADSQAQWVDPHWLLYVRAGTLLAQRVDIDRARTVGDPIAVAGPVLYSAATNWSEFAASFTGTVAFQSHVNVSRVVWFDRAGSQLRTTGAPAGYYTLRLSADGSRLLFSRMRDDLGTFDLWIVDLGRQSETPVTTSPGMETGEVWVPGERAVVFGAARGGPPNLYHKDLVTGVERRLQTSVRFQFPNDVRSDGSLVAYQQRTDKGPFDLMAMRLDGSDEIVPLFTSPANEYGLRFSPDGHRVAFVSEESRRPEVYVAPFPVTGARTAASAGGGSMPRWRRDGRELYYVGSDGRLMAVPIDVRGVPGPPHELFRIGNVTDFDVTADGRQFVVVQPVIVAREQPLSVIVNWSAASSAK